jgi:hypothetical protein
VEKGKLGLAGGEGVTFADIALMAPVEYFSAMLVRDWIEGFGVLRTWYQRMKGESWVVGMDELGEIEKTGQWGEVLGE